MSSIILIGMRGCGKTFLGKALAAHLALPFIDTDAQLTTTLGMPLSNYISQHGWDAFRAAEARCIASLTPSPTAIISTGGGAVLLPENRAHLRTLGTVIYLNTPLTDIITHISKDSSRPSLTGKDPAAEAAEVLAIRAPLYRATAHHTITFPPATPHKEHDLTQKISAILSTIS